jgi:hypothetical protein
VFICGSCDVTVSLWDIVTDKPKCLSVEVVMSQCRCTVTGYRNGTTEVFVISGKCQNRTVHIAFE